MNNTLDMWVEGLEVGFEKEAAGGKITLEQLPINYMGNGKPDYNMLVDGKKVGKLYWNMKGYVAENGIPLPNGKNLQIPEGSLASFKSEINKVNKEWKEKAEHDKDEKAQIDIMTDRTPEQEAERDADNREWSDAKEKELDEGGQKMQWNLKYKDKKTGEIINTVKDYLPQIGSSDNWAAIGAEPERDVELLSAEVVPLEPIEKSKRNPMENLDPPKNDGQKEAEKELNQLQKSVETADQTTLQMAQADYDTAKKKYDEQYGKAQGNKAWWDKLNDTQKAAYKAKHKRTKKATIELLKLANKLEGMGRVEEARKIDEIIKGI